MTTTTTQQLNLNSGTRPTTCQVFFLIYGEPAPTATSPRTSLTQWWRRLWCSCSFSSEPYVGGCRSSGSDPDSLRGGISEMGLKCMWRVFLSHALKSSFIQVILFFSISDMYFLTMFFLPFLCLPSVYSLHYYWMYIIKKLFGFYAGLWILTHSSAPTLLPSDYQQVIEHIPR